MKNPTGGPRERSGGRSEANSMEILDCGLLGKEPVRQGEQALGSQDLLLVGNGGMRSEHSPVGAAGSVSVASGEVRLVYTLHKGLRDGTSGNPHSTHSTATGNGVS